MGQLFYNISALSCFAMWLPQILYKISGQFFCSNLSYVVKMYFGTEQSFLFGCIILEYLDNEFEVYSFKFNVVLDVFFCFLTSHITVTVWFLFVCLFVF